MTNLDSRPYIECDLSSDSYYTIFEDADEIKLSPLQRLYNWVTDMLSTLFLQFLILSKLDTVYK